MKDDSFEICMHYNLTKHFFNVMLIMKALVDKSDIAICNDVLKYCKDFPSFKLKNMLQVLLKEGVINQNDAKALIGRLTSSKLNIAPHTSEIDSADYLLKKSLFVHLDKYEDKFEFLCFCLGKLHRVVSNQCRLDDIDNPVYQEVLSCGQIYLLLLKDGLATYLQSVKSQVEKCASNGFNFRKDYLQKLCNRANCLSPQVVSAISTGNFIAKSFGLNANTGWTIKLNRTNIFELVAQITAVCKFAVPYYAKYGRSFYPESWGFLCPVQTPEGENCGLYNQLASQCKLTELSDEKMKTNVLCRLGVVPFNDPAIYHTINYHPVIVDGRIIGWIHEQLVRKLLVKLKELKVSGSLEVPYHTEIAFISKDQHLIPGLYIYSSSCRMIRKVRNLCSSKAEFTGIFEQVFPSIFTYVDSEDETHFLSLSAAMIPFFEKNFAVRNIFSSVKVKQALGIPFYNFSGHSPSKFSHFMYTQSPIVSSKIYTESNFNFYPYGTNVIIAVLSYTGLDMEDAVTLNKDSVARGILDTMTYKTIYYEYDELAKEFGYKNWKTELQFKRDESDPFMSGILDDDGLPFVGLKLQHKCPLLSVYNKKTGEYLIKLYPERHDAYVSSVKKMGDIPTTNTNIPKCSKKVSVTYCMRKVPEVGDKFSNRHGGKGICSALLPREDLPFTGDGLVPDVLFNPHGLPSRMSIGLLFEMAAAKIHITKGLKCSVEPFQNGKPSKIHKKIGDGLIEAGFNFHGTEKFYSGTSGVELDADVFCGSIYYLRLHHMVQDKFQVRSIGPVDEKTNQPINTGRSGAIRFGEMERDSILSHGAIYLTLDRLLHNSDKCTAYLCVNCHQILHPVLQDPLPYQWQIKKDRKENRFCLLCLKESHYPIQIPYVLIYLITELSVLGIKTMFSEN